MPRGRVLTIVIASVVIVMIATGGLYFYFRDRESGPLGPPTYTIQGTVVDFKGNASFDFQRYPQLDSCPSTGSCGYGQPGVTLSVWVGVGLSGNPTCSGPQYVITNVSAAPSGAFNVTLPGPQLPLSLPFDHGGGCVWTAVLDLDVQIVARGPLVQPLNLTVTAMLV